jgi:protein-disulfide isomerase
MRILAVVVSVAALVGCGPPKSRLDSAPRTASVNEKAEAPGKAGAEASAPGAPGAGAPAAGAPVTPGAPAPGDAGGPAPLKIDRSGTVEQQLARLQDAYDRNAEATAFLSAVYAQQKKQLAEQDRQVPAEDAMFAVNVTGSIKAGQVDGPASAPVTIIKAFDFTCPYCQRVAATMDELVREYNGKVRVVYANMIVHPNARPAHLASCAAAKQGKYKQFKNAFWEKGFKAYAEGGRDESKLGEENILAIAKELRLDTARLKTDMKSSECEVRIQSDMEELEKFRVNSTPTFFINGKHVAGALSIAEYKQLIDAQLKVVEASGVPGAEYYDKVVLGKGEKQFRSKADPRPN